MSDPSPRSGLEECGELASEQVEGGRGGMPEEPGCRVPKVQGSAEGAGGLAEEEVHSAAWEAGLAGRADVAAGTKRQSRQRAWVEKAAYEDQGQQERHRR